MRHIESYGPLKSNSGSYRCNIYIFVYYYKLVKCEKAPFSLDSNTTGNKMAGSLKS